MAEAHVEATGKKVIVQAPAASRYLYEFADGFEAVEAVPGASDDVRGQVAGPVLDHPEADRWEPSLALYREERASWAAGVDRGLKSWRMLGDGGHHCFFGAVAVAFRPPKAHRGTVHGFKAWPAERCAELVARLEAAGERVVSVGGPDNWHFGGSDLRGEPLDVQCAALRSCKACVGPSSGAMHLAALCATSLVTWYDQPDTTSSRVRYYDAWNPFGVGVEYLPDRCPTADAVFGAVSGLL